METGETLFFLTLNLEFIVIYFRVMIDDVAAELCGFIVIYFRVLLLLSCE
jgi:hypothetical protein